MGNPVSTALSFDKQKADEIFIIDIDAFKNNLYPDFEILKNISKNISTPITFGGGIKTFNLAKLAFKNGADKVYLNSILFKNVDLINEISKIYGQQAIVGGINLIKKKNKYFIYNQKDEIDPIKHIQKLERIGVGELKITFVNLEGTKQGIDLKYCKEIIKSVSIPCIFEGGISNLEEVKKLIQNGIDSLSLGSMLYFSDNNIIKIKKFLINENLPVVLDY